MVYLIAKPSISYQEDNTHLDDSVHPHLGEKILPEELQGTLVDKLAFL